MKKTALVLLAMVMLISIPCLAFDGYQGHEGQIPICQNKKTGALRFAPMKDIDPTIKSLDYEPYCSTLSETMIWMNIQGIQGPQGPMGPQGLMPHYSKVAIVAQSGGDYDNPATAMMDCASWCGTPSTTNPCLLKIMPGVYPIDTSSVVMQNYIDIEGSGENVTVIQGNTGSLDSGVVAGADAEVRFLTVKNTGGGANAIAIRNINASPKFTNVSITASGGTDNYGVYNSTSSPTMTNVTITVLGGTNSYGVFSEGSSKVKIHNSVIEATIFSLWSSGAVTTLVANTELVHGLIYNLGGTLTCVGAYNGNYAAVDANCS